MDGVANIRNTPEPARTDGKRPATAARVAQNPETYSPPNIGPSLSIVCRASPRPIRPSLQTPEHIERIAPT